MIDRFSGHAVGLAAPYDDGAPVTPSDTDDLALCSRALWIGGAGSGTLRVTTIRGTELNFAGVPVGFFPIRAQRVYSTGTTVTGIVALY